MRGRMTEEIQKVGYKRLGYNISQTELRLMPYVHYCAMNLQPIDPARINGIERQILSEWRADGYMTGGASETVRVTKQFWDAMCEILWHGYVNHE